MPREAGLCARRVAPAPYRGGAPGSPAERSRAPAALGHRNFGPDTARDKLPKSCENAQKKPKWLRARGRIPNPKRQSTAGHCPGFAEGKLPWEGAGQVGERCGSVGRFTKEAPGTASHPGLQPPGNAGSGAQAGDNQNPPAAAGRGQRGARRVPAGFGKAAGCRGGSRPGRGAPAAAAAR